MQFFQPMEEFSSEGVIGGPENRRLYVFLFHQTTRAF